MLDAGIIPARLGLDALAAVSPPRLGAGRIQRSPREPGPQPPTSTSAVSERLRAAGIDVVRVSYPDMIGVDRGRDVLLDELPTAVGHGLAFCRAVYHTSPDG